MTSILKRDDLRVIPPSRFFRMNCIGTALGATEVDSGNYAHQARFECQAEKKARLVGAGPQAGSALGGTTGPRQKLVGTSGWLRLGCQRVVLSSITGASSGSTSFGAGSITSPLITVPPPQQPLLTP